MSNLPFQRNLALMLAAALILAGAGFALAQVFQQASPGYRYEFPRDHASHPAFKTEWWYTTGHLQTADNRRYGYELTFFRANADVGNLPQGTDTALEDIALAHLALTDETGEKFYYTQKLNRSNWQVAGFRTDMPYVWNELWFFEQLGERFVLQANANAHGNPFGLHLMLTPEKQPVIHGVNGISRKAACEGCASHYYSLTRLDTAGYLFIGEEAVPVTGLSWMDHEFGSNQLTAEQTGWDWFSIQLDDGTDVMLYLLRRKDGTIEPISSGTIVDARGNARHITLDEFTVKATGQWKSPNWPGKDVVYPMGWEISIPGENLQLTVTPSIENQELAFESAQGLAYWEGSSRVRGRHGAESVTGQAYVEMTGYVQEFETRI